MTDPEYKVSNLMARKRTSRAMALGLLCGEIIVGCHSNPALQFVTFYENGQQGIEVKYSPVTAH